MKKRTHYHAHETAREDALDGLKLASFTQRLLGYAVDTIVAVIVWAPAAFSFHRFVLHQQDFNLNWDMHEKSNILVMVLYLGLANYFGNGRTPGKWVARTRAVSLTSERMGKWQSVERVLGYGAAVLEGGLGFLQYFWNRNRQCAQDRLAETIVVDERKSAKRVRRLEAEDIEEPVN
ncbi:MAG: RDD family protein [Acidobacteriota bacterium]